MCHYNSCPRCGLESLERLKTYSHCANCLYAEDYYLNDDSLYAKAVQIERDYLADAEPDLVPDTIQDDLERTA